MTVNRIILLIILSISFPDMAAGTDYTMLRLEMVRDQIERRGITDQKVLNAIRRVKRHLFVSDEYMDSAYTDGPLPIGEGQTISQPYIVALMTELLHLKGDEKILEIGTGSGYQAAILGEIVKTVYTIEIVKKLAESASKLLKRLEYKNIIVRHGDGYRGWEENAPFDGIIVTAAPAHIPEPLKEQLKIGARMVIPVGRFYQKLMVISRTKHGYKEEEIIPVRFVPMLGEAK